MDCGFLALSTTMTPVFFAACVDCGGSLESGLASPPFSLNSSVLRCLKSVSCFGRLKDFSMVGPCLVDRFSLNSEVTLGNVEGNSEEKLAGGLLLSWDFNPKLGTVFAGAGAGVEAVAVDGKVSLVKLVSIFMMP